MRLFLLTMTYFAASIAFANNQFECKSMRGDIAYISFQGRNLQFHDRTHSAVSRGLYIGSEDANFSPEKGYYVFDLVDFYRTNDSRFYVKLEPGFNRKAVFKLIHGFDDDGHEVDEVRFACKAL